MIEYVKTELKPIEREYTKEQLHDMLTINGCFKKERDNLMRHPCSTFKPKLPEKLSKDDLKTVVDLAVFSGFVTLILPSNPHMGGLKRRASVYGLTIEECMHGTQRKSTTPQ